MIAVITIILVSLFLFYLVDFLVVRRINRLSRQIEKYPAQAVNKDIIVEAGAKPPVSWG